MKKKTIQELRLKTKEEIVELIRKTEKELVKFRLEKEAGRLRNVHLVETKSNELAVLKTILGEKTQNENIGR